MRYLKQYTKQHPDPRTYRRHKDFVYDIRAAFELELEECPMPDDLMWWHKTIDHSLRGDNAYEFKCVQPLGPHDMALALKEFETELGTVVPRISHRCSTHIHFDFRDKTVDQLAKTILVLSVVEPLLLRYVGEQRAYSQYALPISYTKLPIAIARITRVCDVGAMYCYDTAMQEGCKYQAVNYLPLANFGSLEVRYLGGEYRVPYLMRWLNILLSCCKRGCETPGTLQDEVTYIREVGPEKYANDIFGSLMEYLTYTGYVEDMYKNLIDAQIFSAGRLRTEEVLFGIDLMWQVSSTKINPKFKELLENSPNVSGTVAAAYRDLSQGKSLVIWRKNLPNFSQQRDVFLNQLKLDLGE